MTEQCNCACGNTGAADNDQNVTATGILHTNAFVDLNGVPYVLADYLDRNGFNRIDRSYVQSSVYIDRSESMRTIVDISIDCIGKNTDTSLKVDGNTTKQAKLLEMINAQKESLGHQLGVLRANLVARINYRVKEQGNGSVIRSTTDDLVIPNRTYWIDINPKDINNNAIITNFSGVMISGVNAFTHGNSPMVLEVTDIQLYYEFVKRITPGGRVKEVSSLTPNTYIPPYNLINANTSYHFQQQQHVCLDTHQTIQGAEINPTSWMMFNRFYHFDNDGKDLILHMEEIYHSQTDFALIPCGKITLNRSFVVNPCQRLVFKLSVWKNDVTLVNNTAAVCEALQATPNTGVCTPIPGNQSCSCTGENDSLNIALRMLGEANQVIAANKFQMQKMSHEIRHLRHEINILKNPIQTDPSEPVPPDGEDPGDDRPPIVGSGCECGCEHPTFVPIPSDYISDLIDRIP